MATPNQILGQSVPEFGGDKKWLQPVDKLTDSTVGEFLRQLIAEFPGSITGSFSARSSTPTIMVTSAKWLPSEARKKLSQLVRELIAAVPNVLAKFTDPTARFISSAPATDHATVNQPSEKIGRLERRS